MIKKLWASLTKRFRKPPPASAGIEAHRQCRINGGDTMACVRAYFEAEPVARANLAAKCRRGVGVNIGEIIRGEEARYLALLEGAPATIKRVCGNLDAMPSNTDLVRLWDERGIDPETAAGAVGVEISSDDVERIRQLVLTKQGK